MVVWWFQPKPQQISVTIGRSTANSNGSSWFIMVHHGSSWFIITFIITIYKWYIYIYIHMKQVASMVPLFNRLTIALPKWPYLLFSVISLESIDSWCGVYTASIWMIFRANHCSIMFYLILRGYRVAIMFLSFFMVQTWFWPSNCKKCFQGPKKLMIGILGSSQKHVLRSSSIRSSGSPSFRTWIPLAPGCDPVTIWIL